MSADCGARNPNKNLHTINFITLIHKFKYINKMHDLISLYYTI